MMDIAQLAASISALLVPHLPVLLKTAADGAAKALGSEVGKHALELPKKLWDLLSGKVEASPTALQAVSDVAKEPDDEDNQAAFRKEIKKLLKDDEALAQLLSELLNKAGAESGNQYTATAGDGGVAVARDLHGGVRITNTFGSKK